MTPVNATFVSLENGLLIDTSLQQPPRWLPIALDFLDSFYSTIRCLPPVFLPPIPPSQPLFTVTHLLCRMPPIHIATSTKTPQPNFKMAHNFLSFNAKGLNSPFKRNTLIKELLSQKTNILFAQETPFSTPQALRLPINNFSTVLRADRPSEKRGVLIAIKDTIQFQQEQLIFDLMARFIILVCLLDSVSYTLVHVYTPNVHQIRFLSKVLAKMKSVCQGNVNIGDDFNMVTDASIGSSSSPRS